MGVNSTTWTKKDVIEVGKMVNEIKSLVKSADDKLCELNDYIITRNPNARTFGMDEILSVKNFKIDKI